MVLFDAHALVGDGLHLFALAERGYADFDALEDAGFPALLVDLSADFAA